MGYLMLARPEGWIVQQNLDGMSSTWVPWYDQASFKQSQAGGTHESGPAAGLAREAAAD